MQFTFMDWVRSWVRSLEVVKFTLSHQISLSNQVEQLSAIREVKPRSPSFILRSGWWSIIIENRIDSIKHRASNRSLPRLQARSEGNYKMIKAGTCCPISCHCFLVGTISFVQCYHTISFVALHAGDTEIWKNHPCSLDSILNLSVIKTGLQQLKSDQAVLFPFPEMWYWAAYRALVLIF